MTTEIFNPVEDLLNKANKLVNDYALSEAAKAVAQVERFLNPNETPCRCKNCTLSAVERANEWIRFMAGDNIELADQYVYHVAKGKRGPVILRPDAYTLAKRRKK